MTTKRPQDEAFLDDQNDSAKKQKVEESAEPISTETTDQQTTSAPVPVSQSADSEVSVSQLSQSQGASEANGSESQGTPVSDEKKPKKPRAPPKPKTPKTPKKKPNISVKEINAAFKDFKLLPESLSVEDARSIFKAASRYKCLWEDNDWKTVFTRCWGDKETTDSSLQAFNTLIASTNVSFHVFSDKFVIKGNQKAQEGGKIDWFEFVATKDFSEELQEIFNEGVKWGNEAELKVFGSVIPIDVRGLPASFEVTSVTNDDSFFVSEMETQLNHDPNRYKKVKDFFESSFFRRYKYKASDEKFTLHYIKYRGTDERLVIGVIPQNKLYFGFYAIQKLSAKPEETLNNQPSTPTSTDD